MEGGRRQATLERLEQRLGYGFGDEALLDAALTHRSHLNEHRESRHTNERLEFLGDSVLGLLVSERLYGRYPRASEGDLTRYRASLVNRRTLASIARELELGNALLIGKGARAAGEHLLDSILADTLEAVLGAAYLDGGAAACEQIIERLFGERILVVEGMSSDKDAKSRLQELTQGRFKVIPSYSIIQGPPTSALFQVEARVNGELVGVGSGPSKGVAEQAAATEALVRLQPPG